MSELAHSQVAGSALLESMEMRDRGGAAWQVVNEAVDFAHEGHSGLYERLQLAHIFAVAADYQRTIGRLRSRDIRRYAVGSYVAGVGMSRISTPDDNARLNEIMGIVQQSGTFFDNYQELVGQLVGPETFEAESIATLVYQGEMAQLH